MGNLDDLRISDSRFSPTPTEPSEAVMLDAAVSVIARLAETVACEQATTS